MGNDVFYERKELCPAFGLVSFLRRYHFFESNPQELNSDKSEVIKKEDRLSVGASLLVIYNAEILTLAGIAGYALKQGLEILLNQM